MLAAGSAVVCCLFFVSAANGMERNNTMKKSLVQKLGLLGVVSFLSYALVVLLSIVSLSVIILAGAKSRDCRSYGICAGAALLLMLTGALGMKLVPADFFGVVERFSVFAATGFNAALGVHLFCAKPETESRSR